MMRLNLIRGKAVLYNNFSPYLLSDTAYKQGRHRCPVAADYDSPLSDTASEIILSFPEVDRRTAIEQALYKLRSEIGTNTNLDTRTAEAEVVSRLMPATRALRLVVSRKPKAFLPDETLTKYILCYVVETLECGHTKDVHFVEGVEPLIAKRRVCHKCQGFHGALPFAPPKKPAQSVRQIPAKKREAV